MLPTKRRIKKEFFPKIVKEGLFVHSNNFYLRLLDRKDQQPSLFAVVVPIKVKKTSVGRHLIKRKIIAAVESYLSNTLPGYSSIIFVKKDTSLLPYREIKNEVQELLIKAQTLKAR
jgi:ribonuclease P protein component